MFPGLFPLSFCSSTCCLSTLKPPCWSSEDVLPLLSGRAVNHRRVSAHTARPRILLTRVAVSGSRERAHHAPDVDRHRAADRAPAFRRSRAVPHLPVERLVRGAALPRHCAVGVIPPRRETGPLCASVSCTVMSLHDWRKHQTVVSWFCGFTFTGCLGFGRSGEARTSMALRGWTGQTNTCLMSCEWSHCAPCSDVCCLFIIYFR